MSQVQINVDTVAKTVECNIDGEKFSNVKHIYIDRFTFLEGDKTKAKIFLEITTDDQSVGDELKKVTRIVTASDKKAQIAVSAGEGTLSPDKTLIAHKTFTDLENAVYKLLGVDSKKKKKSSIY